MAQNPECFAITEADIHKMLASQVHIGARNLDFAMSRYVYKRRSDGVYIINLQKTWEKLLLAARVLVTIENPKDICALSARPYGQRAVLKFAKYTGANAISGRYTPGTFTNQIQRDFVEPRLLVLTDPRTDSQPIRESSYVNIPTIAFAHTDSPLRHVDVAIPSNNKGKHSVGLMWWMLAREYIRMRNKLDRTIAWDVMVDMFFYRDADEQERQEAEQAAQQAAAATAAQTAPAAGFDAAAITEGGATPGGAADWNAAGAADVTWDATTPSGEWGATPDGDAPAPAAAAAAPAATTAAPAAGATPGGASWDGNASWDQNTPQ